MTESFLIPRAESLSREAILAEQINARLHSILDSFGYCEGGFCVVDDIPITDDWELDISRPDAPASDTYSQYNNRHGAPLDRVVKLVFWTRDDTAVNAGAYTAGGDTVPIVVGANGVFDTAVDRHLDVFDLELLQRDIGEIIEPHLTPHGTER